MTPSIGRFDAPKRNSGRRCLLCGASPAGRAHVKVTWFRGDDIVLACCKACSLKSTSAKALLATLERRSTQAKNTEGATDK